MRDGFLAAKCLWRHGHASVICALLTTLACSPSPQVVPESPAAVARDTATPESTAATEATPIEREPEAAPAPPPPYEPDPRDLTEPAVPLLHAERLDTFYARLTALDLGQHEGKVRVMHYGDSVLGGDGISGAARLLMQQRFGDGGAGFVYMRRYNNSYRNQHARIDASDSWKHCYIAYGCLGKPGDYGLGGIVFTSTGASSTRLSTLDEGPVGNSVASAELWYQAHPRGGRLKVSVDGEPVRTLDSRADRVEDRWESIAIDPGPHTIELRAAGQGKVRAYGVVLETDQPGIVWDVFTMIGAYTRRLLFWSPEHIARQVAHRDPDLLVMQYGGNDLGRFEKRTVTPDGYAEEYAEVLQLMRAGKPDLPCVVMSVIDHGRTGKMKPDDNHVARMVETQARIADENGCAFFNSYQAMGGAGSMVRLRKSDPPLASPDLKHLNVRGRRMIGEQLQAALMAGYVEYRRSRHGGAAPRARLHASN